MKNKHNFRVRALGSAWKRSHLSVFAMVFGRLSSVFVLVAASTILAFAIHSAFAAPSGPPTNPASTVSPNFDGMTVTGGGKVYVKNGANTFNTIEIDGQESQIKAVRDAAGTTGVTVNGKDGTLGMKGAASKLSLTDSTGLLELIGTGLNIITAGSQKINLTADDNGSALNLFSAFGITKPYLSFLVDGTTSKFSIVGADNNKSFEFDGLAGTLAMKDATGKDTIGLNSQTGSINLVGELQNTGTTVIGGLTLEKPFTVSDGLQVNKWATILEALTANGVTSTSTIQAQGNISSTNGAITAPAIGKFRSKSSGWQLISNLAPNAVQKITVTCEGHYEKVTGCIGNTDGGLFSPMPAGASYEGGYPAGSNACTLMFRNTSASPLSFYAYGYAFCFDPSQS